MICDRCIHNNVCGVEGAFEPALTYCRDFLGWIPVSERLPEEKKTVIASTEYGAVYPEARYTKENGWEWAYESGADYWEEFDCVTAWMPLPKSYEPQQESESKRYMELAKSYVQGLRVGLAFSSLIPIEYVHKYTSNNTTSDEIRNFVEGMISDWGDEDIDVYEHYAEIL